MEKKFCGITHVQIQVLVPRDLPWRGGFPLGGNTVDHRSGGTLGSFGGLWPLLRRHCCVFSEEMNTLRSVCECPDTSPRYHLSQVWKGGHGHGRKHYPPPQGLFPTALLSCLTQTLDCC